MKKLLAVVLIVVMALSLVACGGGGGIVGTWKLAEGQEDEMELFGAAIEFAKNGKVNIVVDGLDNEYKEYVEGLYSLVTIKYEVKGNTLELEYSFFGVAGEKETFEFEQVDANTIKIDGQAYTRVK